MKTIDKILVPTDFSDTAANAFVYALLLADAVDAEIQLLHCIYPGMAVGEVPAYTGDLVGKMLGIGQENMVDFIERGITKVVQQLATLPKISDKVEIGNAITTTQRMAEEDHFDLVVMGTQGAHDTWGNLFGTRSSGVLVNAPCPVLIVPEKAHYKAYRKFCFATDLEGFDVLSGRTLVTAFHPLQPDLHFLHVNLKEAEEHPLDFELIGMLYERQEVPFKVSASEVTSTDIAEAIIKEAENMEADMIVMSRPHYSFLEQLFHKSFTREVALHTSLPLLVLSEGSEMKAGFK